MSRRLEGPRLDIGRVDTSGTQQARDLHGEAIKRRRLAGVDPFGSSNRADGAAGAEPSEVQDFEALARNGRKSLDDALIEFVMPRVPDPAILRRSVSILQHCMKDLVPGLEGGEQLRSLARTLMQDEIERHRQLLQRLQGGGEL